MNKYEEFSKEARKLLDKARGCEYKIRYSEAAAIEAGVKYKQNPYRSTHCAKWHLTKDPAVTGTEPYPGQTKSSEEIVILFMNSWWARWGVPIVAGGVIGYFILSTPNWPIGVLACVGFGIAWAQVLDGYKI